jgi:protein ImuB
VPVHAVTLGVPQAAAAAGRPWPGHLPPPSPAVVHPVAPPAQVLDAEGGAIGVTGRGVLVGEPASVAVAGGPVTPVVTWHGPWPVDERWWDPVARRRRARLQVLTAAGDAYLLALEGGRWRVEATYD